VFRGEDERQDETSSTIAIVGEGLLRRELPVVVVARRKEATIERDEAEGAYVGRVSGGGRVICEI
jgi:hypothetical protein